MPLNENNIQAPFQYKIGENTFELLKRNGELELNTDNVQVKVFSGQRLFCADIGYAVDGPLEEMEFLIDDIKVYPQLLENLKDLQTADVKDNEIYLVNNDINFKSIIFFPPSDLNKNFKFNITTYSSTFSSFMFDEIAKKLNTLDTNYPVKNYYENTDYKVNDIIKYNGYLYRVFRDFTSDSTDYYLKSNCNLLTPFKKLELDTVYKANELIEYENNFFIVQEDFSYNQASGPLTNLNGLLKPLQDIIIWFDGISKIYKNQIIIKDNFSYIVLEDIENPVWGNIQSKLDYFNKASNTFYDDTNSGFGNNTNTVQKAIEKLKSGKQDSLTEGNNINLNGSNISVIGGTSKEYVLENNYFINDLIIKDEKIYRVDEDFISSDWSTDRAKLTLISSGGGGGSTEAIDVSYDNSKTNLEYISGYDFPKFKTPIADTINLVLASSTSASITKQEDQSYRLQANLSNVIPMLDMIFIPITSIEDQTKRFGISNILLQFFDNITIIMGSDFSNVNYTALKPDECSISEIDSPLEFALCEVSGSIFIVIKRQDDVLIPQSNYTVNLNIKNRVLRNQDSNLFYLDNVSSNTTNIEYNFLSLEANESNTVVTGTVTNLAVGTISGFYIINNIIPNYFNLDGDYITTSGITSSSGKAVEYKVISAVINSESAYTFSLKYTDGSEIQQGDVFTFNLTPDKNSTLDPIYSPVANVQQAIEVLIKRYNIPLYCYVYPEDDGTFDDRKRPANYYYNLFGVTTVWKKRFSNTGASIRFEGGFADENRNGLIQEYATKRMIGRVGIMGSGASGCIFDEYSGNGVLFHEESFYKTFYNFTDAAGFRTATRIKFDNLGADGTNKNVSDNETRSTNIKVELYELISINGINIWGRINI